jgi:hypothetical protein
MFSHISDDDDGGGGVCRMQRQCKSLSFPLRLSLLSLTHSLFRLQMYDKIAPYIFMAHENGWMKKSKTHTHTHIFYDSERNLFHPTLALSSLKLTLMDEKWMGGFEK